MSEKENLSEIILNSIDEAVFTVDKNFRINYFNKSAEQLTGYKREEVKDKICRSIFKTCSDCTLCPIGMVLESGKNLNDYETEICTKSKSKIQVKLNAAILKNEAGEPVGGVVYFRDISFMKSIGRELNCDNSYRGIIGRSPKMLEIFDLIEEIRESDATVFIRGESGTGKEIIAEAIQVSSNRKLKPFVKVNCSVFPSSLLASELFGHVKGAFTDAFKDRMGRFELASSGTIFLDEVGEIPTEMQPQLLRVLQEGTFERVGESVTRKVDVRIIAATNINIDNALRSGKFREDLFYRFNVIPIVIPPLRDRREDIPLLIKHFIKKFALAYNRPVKSIPDSVMQLLVNYDYPGNVRELENIIEFAFVRSANQTVMDEKKFPLSMLGEKSLSYSGLSQEIVDPSLQTGENDELDRSTLLSLLERHQWNRTRVAEELGIGRTTLWRKMKQHNIIE